ncbi:uncharacterized protein LOC131014744 isoform X2 [Salvia miltiorrhiza]|uniref:uncharacterized protein LOC131014744 isoform X2 n=1 Tax=Salvia miltiorrhiza TaxID=226208 RepID=UPI0025AB7ED4|nr:uncharacterized protein LOC131014744 isoform X2 [Salvia miltiorrhiza]
MYINTIGQCRQPGAGNLQIQFNLPKMESFSDESLFLSYSDYFNFLLLRPLAAILFTVSLLFFGWFLAWKLVLVHVPLVQEIFGLRKKTIKPKPPGRRRLTQFYNRINAQNPSSEDAYAHKEILFSSMHLVIKRARVNQWLK